MAMPAFLPIAPCRGGSAVSRRALAAGALLCFGAAIALSAPAFAQVAVPGLMTNPGRSSDHLASIIYGGDILTMEGATPTYAEAIAVKDGTIIFVGSRQQALAKAGKGARQLDLKGKTLMPGFIDAHMHPLQGASMLMPKYVTPFDWAFPWGDAPAVRGQAAFLERVGSQAKAIEDPAEPLVVWGYSKGNLDPKAASERSRLGSLTRAGVPVALHTDFTMAPLSPLLLAWIATNRVTALGTLMAPEERLSAYDALKGVTINAAYVLRLEKLTGSIATGKKADFVLLAENPLKVDPKRIKDVQIIGTVFEGRPFPLVLSDTATMDGKLKPDQR